MEHAAKRDKTVSNDQGANQTQIFTVLNLQGAEGGFKLLVWNFNRALHQLDLVDTKVLENRRGAVCTHLELTASTK